MVIRPDLSVPLVDFHFSFSLGFRGAGRRSGCALARPAKPGLDPEGASGANRGRSRSAAETACAPGDAKA